MRLAVFTIAANPHVAQTRVLLQTVQQFLPLADTFLILADERHPAVPYPDGCTVIAAHELGIADFAGFSFRYDMTEFAAALKPLAFLHLLGPQEYTHCLYFAPDIELFSTVPAITDALAANASLILTPQLLAPAERRDGPNDVAVMREGVFNLGFIGASGTAEARNLLAWWARWLRWRCVNDRPAGLFVDQKFMDLAPGFAPNACVLHDPGLNVGYWNLLERGFAPNHPAGSQAGGAALGFFHYHGFDPACPGQLSSETERFRDDALPPEWRDFLAGYAGRLLAVGHGQVPPDCYAYGRFASGVPIPAIVRRMFRDDHPAWAGNPFETFEAWCHLPALQAVTGLGSAVPSMVMQWLHARSPEMAASPLWQPEGAAQTTRWWLQGAALDVDHRFLGPQALAAGQRAPRQASCPPQPGQADVTLITPEGPACQAAQAAVAAAGLRLAAEPAEQAGLRILIPTGERPMLPRASQAALDQVDEIWAPTRFLQAALVCLTDRPVLHMPLAWQFATASGRKASGNYILAVSDGLPGCGEIRAALLAYQCAFGTWPLAPRMVIESETDAWDAELTSMIAAADRVSVARPHRLPAGGTALLSGAACVLALHRGEALGLIVLRAMACGTPVVATDYGGCTDLLTPQTGYPVQYRLEGSAAEVDPHHAAWWLRRVFDQQGEATRRAAAARLALARACDPARAAAALAQRLRELGLQDLGLQDLAPQGLAPQGLESQGLGLVSAPARRAMLA